MAIQALIIEANKDGKILDTYTDALNTLSSDQMDYIGDDIDNVVMAEAERGFKLGHSFNTHGILHYVFYPV